MKNVNRYFLSSMVLYLVCYFLKQLRVLINFSFNQHLTFCDVASDPGIILENKGDTAPVYFIRARKSIEFSLLNLESFTSLSLPGHYFFIFQRHGLEEAISMVLLSWFTAVVSSGHKPLGGML